MSECLPAETCPSGPQWVLTFWELPAALFPLFPHQCCSSGLLIVNSQKPWESTFSLPFPLLCPAECRERKVISLNGEDERITGTTQRDGMGREEGGGLGMGNTCIPVADSF